MVVALGRLPNSLSMSALSPILVATSKVSPFLKSELAGLAVFVIRRSIIAITFRCDLTLSTERRLGPLSFHLPHSLAARRASGCQKDPFKSVRNL
jgi:hypothetical protein